MQNKIMLIEDDHAMLSLLETLFRLEGFQVISAGEDQVSNLLAKVIRETPNVIILDVNLCHGNGVELLSAIRSNPALDNIRVIMSSGMDYQDECIKNGAQGFILKPYMPDELIRLVKST